MRKIFIISGLFVKTCQLVAQAPDTLPIQVVEPVEVYQYLHPFQPLPDMEKIKGTYLYTGKKNEQINLLHAHANLSEKNGRQIFAKVAGAFIYDMDGSGNQLNLSTRGLDPHRSWEYNVRQNDVLTNSDIYGYPASHYSPPMEAIQRVELVRGTASLQYGAQFGGMINYITKTANTTKPLTFESINTLGSFGLMSTFNALSGQIGKFSYYAYYQKRVSKGYRKNANSDAQAQFISLQYAATPKLTLKAELGRSQYLYQIPGALTDSMFADNPRQATRSRNYFSPDIYLPSLRLDWNIGEKTRLHWISSAVLGNRSSVQFIGLANVKDDIDPQTLLYKPRQVDIDNFNSYSSELRLGQDYRIGRIRSTLVAGLRYTNNHLHRRQQGQGTRGTDYDLSVSQAFGRDIHFKTQNIAIFVENMLKLSPKIELSLGARGENGLSQMTGKISYLPDERIPQQILHRYLLLGANGQYQFHKTHKLYAGFSQAYRPVVLADIIPASILEQNDPNLKDAFGYNLEAGFKGNFKNWLVYDVNFFQILYKNRIGSVALTDAAGAIYFWKTNIGDSRTNGIEAYAEAKIVEKSTHKISIFSATSFFDAEYLNGQLRDGNQNVDLTHKKLETVPTWISRNGLQVAYKGFSALLQYSYVSKSFSDPLNTIAPNASGTKGIVPAYGLWDLNMAYRFSNNYTLKVGFSNLTNKQYFTKRPTGYPGQGVWNSDGRGVQVSLGIRI